MPGRVETIAESSSRKPRSIRRARRETQLQLALLVNAGAQKPALPPKNASGAQLLFALNAVMQRGEDLGKTGEIVPAKYYGDLEEREIGNKRAKHSDGLLVTFKCHPSCAKEAWFGLLKRCIYSTSTSFGCP